MSPQPLPNTTDPSRRDFLKQTVQASLATAGLCSALGPRPIEAAEPSAAKVAFFVVGDTHFLAEKESPAKMNAQSAAVCGRLVDALNRLPGTEIPPEAGGGEVIKPSGLIHAGDIIDTGDKNGRVQLEMQRTEWSAFTEAYGLTGADGRLQLPVYEVFGNHDAPHGAGLALEKIKERNKRRPGLADVADNGVHYSWDWGPAHFINLGLIVGDAKAVARKRRYAALDSFDFLVADLKANVGSSGRPIIITHHIDIARHTGPCDPAAPPDNKEWDACDVRAFHDALQGFNVAGIFYGHTHFREIFQWDGLSKRATSGFNVFNTDNASHFAGAAQAFFYVELHDRRLVVREYATRDAWQTGAFTPQVWTTPFSAG